MQKADITETLNIEIVISVKKYYNLEATLSKIAVYLIVTVHHSNCSSQVYLSAT
jgi:hypothetical protein